MPATVEPLPTGVESVAPGLDEVIVTRLSDPVRVRRAGSVGATALSFVDKRRRLPSGSSVHAFAGGRVEVAWLGEGLIVQLFDSGSLRVGVRERGEPALFLHRPTKSRLFLPRGTTVRLVNVCDIVAEDATSDETRLIGPLWIERVDDETVRLFNHGPVPVRLVVGATPIFVGSSQSIDLPQIGHGALSDLAQRASLARSIVRPDGQALRWTGGLALAPVGGGVQLSATGDSVDFAAFGSLWHLDSGAGIVLFDDPSPPKR